MPEATLSQPAACVQPLSEGVQYTLPETATLTKLKMDHERWRYENIVHKIDARSKLAEEACSRNVQQAKDDHLKTIAYLRVCQIHSFEKYDPFKDDPLYGHKKKIKRKRKQKRRERENTFITLPNVEVDDPETLVNPEKNRSTLTIAALNQTFPQISTRDDIETDNKSMNTSHFNAMVLWKNAAKKLFEKKTDKERHAKEQAPTKQEIAKQARPPRKNVFPGECKTQAALKRFMEHETEQLIQEMIAPRHKKEESIREMVAKAQFPDLITRDKTFSAIVRDFKTYKKEKEERKHRKMIEYINRHCHCND